MNECEQMRDAKLEALRRDIRDGLASGQPETHDMAAIKADARTRRASERKAGAGMGVLLPTPSS